MSVEWYCKVMGVEYGPLTADELKRMALDGKMSPDSFVRKGKEGNWASADRVRGLFDGNGHATPVAQTPIPPPPKQATLPPSPPSAPEVKPIPAATSSSRAVILAVALTLLGVAVLGLSGVGIYFAVRPAKPEIRIPEIYRTQLLKFLEDGGKLQQLSGQGVNFGTFRDQLATAKTSHDLAVSTWPKGFSPNASDRFQDALRAWNLALELWELKLDKKDEPTEPNINGYNKFVEQGRGILVVLKHPNDYIVEEYRGKQYLPFDNIGVLLSIASEEFQEGKSFVLKDIQKSE